MSASRNDVLKASLSVHVVFFLTAAEELSMKSSSPLKSVVSTCVTNRATHIVVGLSSVSAAMVSPSGNCQEKPA